MKHPKQAEKTCLFTKDALIDGVKVNVELTTTRIRFTDANNCNTSDIQISDILGVVVPASGVFGWFYSGYYQKALEIHHITYSSGGPWRVQVTVAEFNGHQERDQWRKYIKELLDDPGLKRPRKLLVFLNPRAGNGKAVSIFESQVAPLFNLADIKVTVIVTRRGGESTDVIKSYDLTQIDGVVCMGGDGTIMQCAQGLVMATARNAGIDINNADSTLPTTSIRMGILPAGSGNGLVGHVTGLPNLDVMTSALMIIKGCSSSLDLGATYMDGTLVELTSLVHGYGTLADAVAYIDGVYRWLPWTLRVILGAMTSLWKSQPFTAEVKYLPVTRAKDGEAEIVSCLPEWLTQTEELTDFQAMYHPFTQRTSVEKGAIELKLTRPSTIMERLTMSYAAGKVKDTRCEEVYPHGQFIKVKEYKFRRLDSIKSREKHFDSAGRSVDHRMMTDGEIVNTNDPPSFHTKLHSNVLRIFGVN